jgi:hypothetical protein
MNKDAARAELTELVARAEALKKIIDAPERSKSLLRKPEPGSNGRYWYFKDTCTKTWQVEYSCATELGADGYRQGAIFQTKELAEAYAEALDTLLLLRHQPGTEPVSTLIQTQIILEESGAITYRSSVYQYQKYQMISPCFINANAARNAVDAIGAERIFRMFRILQGTL